VTEFVNEFVTGRGRYGLRVGVRLADSPSHQSDERSLIHPLNTLEYSMKELAPAIHTRGPTRLQALT